MGDLEHHGKTIDDRYTVEERIGRGGVGVVWRAEDRLLRRRVAVKEVEFPTSLPEHERAAARERVLREARSAAQLNHPGAVTIFDVVEENGSAYVVMELIDAPSLADLVAREGPLALDRAAEIGLGVLDALEAAHKKGIVHRDVKPANIMVPREGPAKLADFGIASVKGDPKITASGMVLGSPSFMAPEQATGKAAGPETDLWSLGATLYFAVEGRLPFDRGQPIPTLAAVVHDPPEPLIRAGALGPVIAALLEKDPARRPDVARARAMLIGERRGGAEAATTAGVVANDESVGAETMAPTPPDGTRSVEPSPVPVPPGDRQDKRARYIMAGLAAVALIGLIGLLWWSTTDSDDANTPRERGEQVAPGGEGGEEDAPAPGDGAAGTDEWLTHTDDEVGFSLRHPPEWELVPDSVDADSIDFRDPASGTYLRVDWTDAPGDDPVAAWEEQAESFAASHAGYDEIRIEPTTYKGFDAAIWEFEYDEGGARLHALDLGFVTDEHGFALFFQTQADEWLGSQDLMQALQDSFQAP
jgi:hypothetical protein